MSVKFVKIFFLIFYLAGIIGILVPASQALFIKQIPIALLLGIIALILFHESKFNPKFILASIIVFLLGLFIEIIGVNTGVIFGNYTYGNSLSFKILNTPLSIGINWLMLVYISSSIVARFKIHFILKIVLSSLLMVFYDILLELVAPSIDMWYWQDNYVPFRNYLSWFIIALFFQSIFHFLHINTKNKIASFLFGIELAFFFTLAIYFNLLK